MSTISNRDTLIALSLHHKGDWWKIRNAIETKEEIPFDNIQNLLKSVKSQTITILDEDYPEYLRTNPYPPFVLYYYGDISLLNKRDSSLGVIGSRHCSTYGKSMTKTLVSSLAKKLVIVSGLAIGVDSIAAEECLKSGGKTIAVLGSGIDYCYPSSSRYLYDEIKVKGLLISEYPNDLVPIETNFPIRNRIIARLSRNLLITEARRHSGTSSTVSFLQDCSSVMCVPQLATADSLCNELIKAGAKLVTTPADVLEEYNFDFAEPFFEK